MYTVGSVPYLNAKPLVRLFEDLGDQSPVKVIYEVPSLLPPLLESGEADAIMVSSIESLRAPGRRVALGVCIGTQQEVLSVRVFSKVPPTEIRSLALDRSSMTSNALAQIVLHENFGVVPSMEPLPPDLSTMLADHDACVLIGDNGMREEGEGLHILDLGAEWYRLTELPFVWATWMGVESLNSELAGWLWLAEKEGQRRMDAVVADAPAQTRLSFEMCDRYLRHIMHYPLYERELEGLREFGNLIVEHGILPEVYWPELVAPDTSVALSAASSTGPT
ncbi:MAG: menaquinone biosynthesis protein [Fimbriimonas sp.]|nr:menaquinone biosynthesis protein [Fimbriimonas sp.]